MAADTAAAPAQQRKASWQGELRSWLSNPLLVAVVAALLGSLVIPSITRKWQNHQKALEVQTGLVSDMSQAVSSAVASSRFIAAGLVARSTSNPRASQGAWNDLYRTWSTDGASIGAKLQAYFGPAVADPWQAFTFALTDYVGLSAQTAPGQGRQQQVAEIYRYRRHLPGVQLTDAQWRRLAGPPIGAEFQNTFAEVGRGLLARQGQLVRQVLRSHVSGF